MYFLPHHCGTTYHIISNQTADTNEFIIIVSTVSSDFSDEFGEFAQILINENNMEIPQDASSALDLYLYLLSKIKKYS